MPILPRREACGVTVRGCVLLIWLASLTWSAGQGVVLHLKNGDRISGTIITEDTNRVVLSTKWVKELTVPASEIVKRETVDMDEAPAPAPPPPAAPAPAAPAAPPAPAPATVAAKPPKRWFADLQLGANLLFGEKNQQIYTGRLKLTYAYEKFRNVVDYFISYGETDGTISANRMDFSAKTDFDLGSRIYVYNLGGAGYDQIRRVDVRYELGPGVGYHLFRRDRFAMNVETGLNYQEQQLADGSAIEQFYHRLAEDVTWTVSQRMSVDEKFEFFPQVENWGDYRFRFESNLRYLLANNVTLNLTFIDQYDTRRARDVNRNDVQLRSSLGVKF